MSHSLTASITPYGACGLIDFAKAGREKRYDLRPDLLEIHVPRLVEAHRVVGTYMTNTDLLHCGTVAFYNFLGPIAGEIADEIMAVPIKDGKSDESVVLGLPDTSRSKRKLGKIWNMVRQVFQSHMEEEIHRLFCSNTYLQHLYNCPDDNDEQKVYHSDTFFHCVKFWYFPLEVEKDDGPFWYVPNSVVLTPELIAWHEARVKDLREGQVEEWRGPGHREGSFRISPEELAFLGLKPEPVCVEPDTLVVANTHGFHRRGDVATPKHRLSIHGSIRIGNPFTCA